MDKIIVCESAVDGEKAGSRRKGSWDHGGR